MMADQIERKIIIKKKIIVIIKIIIIVLIMIIKFHLSLRDIIQSCKVENIKKNCAFK